MRECDEERLEVYLSAAPLLRRLESWHAGVSPCRKPLSSIEFDAPAKMASSANINAKMRATEDLNCIV
jgi:hypothetical protein